MTAQFKPTFFEAAPLPQAFVPALAPSTKANAPAPWEARAAVPVAPPPAPDDAKKKLYGIELAKNNNPFEAACCLFEDASQALWVSRNWASDPVAIAARDLYLKTLETDVQPLDKKQLAAKVLKFAEEKNIEGTRYLVEAKERLNALRLYSDIMGFTGKIDIDASTKNFTNNEMKIVFVKPEPKQEAPKTINEIPNKKSEILNDDSSPISIKLVGNSR